MLDFIIVGQGLSGSILAEHLLEKNQKILVIDNGFLSSSSHVAAGLWNPLVFRKLTKGFNADNLIDYIYRFYPVLEQKLQQKFFHPQKITRIFADDNQKNMWLTSQEKQLLSPFVGVFSEKYNSASNFKSPFGIGEVNKGGWLNVSVFLKAFNTYLQSINALLTAQFNFNKLSFLSAEPKNGSPKKESFIIDYEGIKAKRIIFCEGYKVRENPFFNWLPISQTKGQTLEVEANLDVNSIVNYGQFILPLQEKNTFKMGATFEWDQTESAITEEAKNKLLKGSEKVVDNVNFKVLNQRAGFRPTVKDRRPILGVHPTNNNLLVFNGMGAKAVLLAPFYANEFSNYLLNSNTLSEKVNIARFYDLYDA